jgi:hypothetical protein
MGVRRQYVLVSKCRSYIPRVVFFPAFVCSACVVAALARVGSHAVSRDREWIYASSNALASARSPVNLHCETSSMLEGFEGNFADRSACVLCRAG